MHNSTECFIAQKNALQNTTYYSSGTFPVTALTVDIVCGTFQAKLLTRDLSCGSSRCIEFGSRTLTPCEFQREAGKASAKNWKNTIRYQDKPLSRNLDSFVDYSGKRCCRFIGEPSRSYPPSSQSIASWRKLSAQLSTFYC